jgi:hypothetical protein
MRDSASVARPAGSQARRAQGSQGWPLSKWFSAHYIFRPLLDWPEQDTKLGRVGGDLKPLTFRFPVYPR